MSEQQSPTGPAPLPPTPPRGTATPTKKPGDPRGSLLLGIGLAWAIMVGGSMAVAPINVMLWPVPPVIILVWAVVLMANDKPRTGQGMLLGLLSVIAVVLLLVAACFGLLYSNGGFHG